MADATVNHCCLNFHQLVCGCPQARLHLPAACFGIIDSFAYLQGYGSTGGFTAQWMWPTESASSHRRSLTPTQYHADHTVSQRWHVAVGSPWYQKPRTSYSLPAMFWQAIPTLICINAQLKVLSFLIWIIEDP